MPKKRKATHPVFGEIKFDIVWEGSVVLEPYGDVDLIVFPNGNSDTPSEAQSTAFEHFRQRFPQLKATIEKEILDYYIGHRDTYLENAVEPLVEVPEINSVKELSTILGPVPNVVVGEDAGTYTIIKLCWDASFDDEHGLTVEIENGKIDYIGPG